MPVKTLPEFVEYARKTKPPLPYASGGNGSQHQLGIEMLKQRAGIDLLHVPYPRRRARPALATVAGETKVVLAGASNAALLQVRPAARARDHRQEALAAVPRPADDRRVLSRATR